MSQGSRAATAERSGREHVQVRRRDGIEEPLFSTMMVENSMFARKIVSAPNLKDAGATLVQPGEKRALAIRSSEHFSHDLKALGHRSPHAMPGPVGLPGELAETNLCQRREH